jgi:hypothetical protein
MSGVTAAIVGSAVVGAGASAMAGRAQSKATKKAALTNKAAMDEANRLNYERFLESRGAYGTAVLPMYMREGEYSSQDIMAMDDGQLLKLAAKYGIDTGVIAKTVGAMSPGEVEAYHGKVALPGSVGKTTFSDGKGRDWLVNQLIEKASQPFEQRAAKEAMEIYGMGKTPEELAASFGKIQEGFRPTMEGASKAITDIYSGVRENERLADFDAVAKERLRAADLTRQEMTLKEQQSRNQLAATNQRKGYVGQGFGAQLGQQRIGQDIANRGALATSVAKLKNIQEKFGIQDQERDLRLANVEQANAATARAMGFETAPQRGMTQAFTEKFAVTNPFRLGVGQAPQTKAYEMPAITPSSAYAWKGVADVAGTIGGLYGSGALGGGAPSGITQAGGVIGPGNQVHMPMAGSGGAAYSTTPYDPTFASWGQPGQ